ncbi:hypothetical protein ACFP1I_28200 [Dyadobacter subterraneus]|uniref:Uncharacterized protein n=1 Tax=Dyadobacter subterraneus TaxID=2773304 RepID=A0ABR9WGH2_9BACT|nr:hypothetical protein [Dyadobacter subterraneus]
MLSSVMCEGHLSIQNNTVSTIILYKVTWMSEKATFLYEATVSKGWKESLFSALQIMIFFPFSG